MKNGAFGYIQSQNQYNLLRRSFATQNSRGGGNFPEEIFSNIGDALTTLMSLREPGIPKNACHIHNERSQIASRVTVCSFSFPLNCPCRAVGQFFRVHLQQSILPSNPGVPRFSDSLNIFYMSIIVGECRYVTPMVSITALLNLFNDSRPVDSAIER